jgi:hypothetical protein
LFGYLYFELDDLLTIICFTHPIQIMFAIQHLVLAKFENGTTGERNVMTGERRYGLVERYEQEKLDDEAFPPFKRILFWNDVYKL